MTSVYSIGDLAREFEVTPRTIRFYEDQGLLSPGRSGQNRVYTTRDRTRLKLILRGKRLGFSLSEIRGILDLYDAPGGEVSQLRYFIAKIHQRRQTLLRQREDLEAVLRELDDIEAQCERLLADKTRSTRPQGGNGRSDA